MQQIGLQPHSCIVDESTQSAPIIINKETNAEVLLTRAYWDANTDLANRNLQCEDYEWNDDSNRYELTGSYNRFHNPLPIQKPWISTWTETRFEPRSNDGQPEETTLLWTVVDGALNDQLTITTLPFQGQLNFLSRVELVDVNGGTRNGTRWWASTNANKYSQCIDPQSNRFIPTGTPGASGIETNHYSDQSVIFSAPMEANPPEIDREEEIVFSRVQSLCPGKSKPTAL